MTTKKSDFPSGWDEQRVRKLLDHYEHQTDEETVAEHEAALSRSGKTRMEVPTNHELEAAEKKPLKHQ